jgi:squalene-hopene/tetraprenyl-beta-curcumene cyclase
LLSCLAVAASLVVADEPAAAPTIDAKTYQQTVDRAVAFLRSKQAADGAFAAYAGPGVTAVAATGLMRVGLGPDDPTVAKALKYLEKFVQPDGGIYSPKNMVQNYETSLAVVCFQEANREMRRDDELRNAAEGHPTHGPVRWDERRYDKIVKNAEQFLRSLQWGGAGQPAEKGDFKEGGAGYGKSKRPDLSNTQFFLDALQAAGAKPDDPAVQAALKFVSRCQNLESEENNTPYAAKNPDGGFYYTPCAVGEKELDKNGGLRSYASMTYAGLKSMIYAGVKSDDPRVKAAVKWCQMHYGLDDNPGMGPAGLYYYYHTFAKALDAAGMKEIADAKGVKHTWRQDLLAQLVRRQRPNGSWVNDDKRWLEGEPCLVTGYALLSLVYCRPAAEK